MRRIIVILVLCLVASCAPTSQNTPPPTPAAASVGVQLFQWPWRSVERECSEVLGENHFGFVLLSPAQEHVEGPQWWTSYQPVSYQIESKLGTREEFQRMVSACHDAGVQVYADAVINHMAGIEAGTGSAGTSFTHYDYPGLYDVDDFHHCDTPGGDIGAYFERSHMQSCELVNLADLRTEDDAVRERIVAHLNDLLALGVDGFRIDAAKHIPAEDVEAIVGGLNGEPVIVSEVLRGSSDPIQPEEYLGSGDVFAFQVSRDLAGVVKSGSLRQALNLAEGDIPTNRAYTFVENHDTERNGYSLSWRDGEQYRLGNALLLGMGYGTPVLYSGYAFTDYDAGAPMTQGRVDDVTCSDEDTPTDGQWLCQHREAMGLVEWRSVVGDAEVANVASDGDNVAFDRGDLGLFAANADDEPWHVTLTTNLPDGSYCNVAVDDCAGDDIVEVTDKAATLRVPAMGVVALHVNARAR